MRADVGCHDACHGLGGELCRQLHRYLRGGLRDDPRRHNDRRSCI
jgi:hypothetical protein